MDKLPPPSLPGILWRTMALASLADPHSPSELGPHAELEGEIPVQPNHHSRKGTPKSQSQHPSVSSYLLSSTILFFLIETCYLVYVRIFGLVHLGYFKQER